MAKRIGVAVYNQLGEKAEKKVNLNGDVFGIETNDQVVFDAVQVYQSNMRQATAKTKTRAEVRGGGKKPWRQKGTGRARAGSNRSPIWVGGGTVFGPTGTQSYKLSMNKKSHELAVKSVLTEKAANKDIILLSSLEVTKTKEFVAVLKALNVEGKALVILNEEADNEATIKAANNVPGVKVVLTNNVCVYDVLHADKLIFTVDAVKKVEGGLK